MVVGWMWRWRWRLCKWRDWWRLCEWRDWRSCGGEFGFVCCVVLVLVAVNATVPFVMLVVPCIQCFSARHRAGTNMSANLEEIL